MRSVSGAQHRRDLDGWLRCTVYEAFRDAVARCGEREALVDPINRAALGAGPPQRLTFAQLAALAERLAAVLAARGVGRNDAVLVQLPNIVELVAAYLAVARLGAVISPVPMQYRRHELREIGAALTPVLSLTMDRFKEAPVAAEHVAALPRGTPILALGGQPPAGAGDLGAALTAAGAAPPPADVRPDDLYTVCWTSGTTGTPKGVPRRHAHWLALVPVFEDAVALPDGAALVCPFPVVNMAAIGGFLVYWLALRGRLVLHHPLDLSVFLKQIQDERAAYTVAPPTLLNMLLARRDLLGAFDLSSLKAVGSGSAPLSPAMVESYERDLGISVINMFGSNEGACLVSDARDVPEPQARAFYFPRYGRPELRWNNRMAARMRTKLVDPDSGEEILERDRVGELLIQGPTVFEGYWNGGAGNASLFDADGFFHTGDLFAIAGPRREFYRFVGRCKDIIVRGGLKISPEELDNILAGHPDVADVATVGVADATLGEKIGVVVVARPGRSPTLETLVAFLEQAGVARFKHPEKLAICDQLPRNPLGKLLRRQLASCFE